MSRRARDLPFENLLTDRILVLDLTQSRRSVGAQRQQDPMVRTLTRRKLLAGAGASLALVRPGIASTEASSTGAEKLKIVSVKAYPVNLFTRPPAGKPRFESDFDPSRWRYHGPFSQLTSAVVVVTKTDQGIVGYGLGGGGRVAAEIIHGHLSHLLIGANPLNVELLWDQMYTSSNTYGRRGVFVMALSGVDNSLWDIVGKFAGQPVYRLLGGTTKEKVPAYFTSFNPATGLALGFQHFKMPALRRRLEGHQGMDRIVKQLSEARKTIGPENSLMIDCGSSWDDIDYTIKMARRLEELQLYWIEEPLSPDNVMGYAQLVDQIDSTLIASGEHEYTRFGFADLLRHRAVDILQPDVSWSGGVTSLRRIAAMAAEHSLLIVPHRGGSRYGLSIVLSTPNCHLAESFGTGDAGNELMEAMTSRFENGYYYPSDKPGFGVELKEAWLKKYEV